MLSFFIAVFLLLITPGPGVLTTAGVGSAFGFNAGARFIIGLFIGTNLVAIAVVSGLAAIVVSEPVIRTLLFWLSAAYLLYLAYKIAFAGAKVAFIETPAAPGIVGGVLLQAINPKAYAVNTALFTGFQLWENALVTEIMVKFLIINMIWIPVHFLWLGAGVLIRKLDLAPRTQFVINCFMASAMLGVVAAAALSEIG